MEILVLESSTTSAKAMLYDTLSKQMTVVEDAYQNHILGKGLQSPEAIYSQTAALARKVCAGRQIGMIVLSATFHSLILCGADMKPATPSYIWSFTGAQEICSELRENKRYADSYYKKTGCPVHSVYPFFKLKHLDRQGYDIKKFFIHGQGDYHFYQLTGDRKVMDSMASGTGLMDIGRLIYDDDLLKGLGIHEEQLPQLACWNETSPLRPQAAAYLGLQPGIPVINAGPDGALNQVGSFALDDGIMTLSVGTSAALRMSALSPRFSEDHSTWCYYSPKKWLNGAATSCGCNCLDWIKELLFPAGTSYEDCENGTESGLEKPFFLPFLYGERSPGWNDRRQASFRNVHPEHTPADYYYSVQEGVLFNIYQSYKSVVSLNGKPKQIKISGGILGSAKWLQMCADVLGSELTVDSVKNSSMTGGLLLALEQNGIRLERADLNDAAEKKISPQPDIHQRLMERYNQYEKFYEKDND